MPPGGGSQSAKTIDALLMNTGSVAGVVEHNQWPSLAGTLQKVFLPIQQRVDRLIRRPMSSICARSTTRKFAFEPI